jgi:hypothetical protein
MSVRRCAIGMHKSRENAQPQAFLLGDDGIYYELNITSAADLLHQAYIAGFKIVDVRVSDEPHGSRGSS